MNSDKSKTQAVDSRKSPGIDVQAAPLRVLETARVDAGTLEIAADVDTGGDPYNSTGQHVIIESRLATGD